MSILFSNAAAMVASNLRILNDKCIVVHDGSHHHEFEIDSSVPPWFGHQGGTFFYKILLFVLPNAMLQSVMTQKPKRKYRPKSTYWPEREISHWITLYNQEPDKEKRDRLFEDHLYVPFKRMAEAVISCHKMSDHVLMSYDDMQTELVSHGASKLGFYKPEKNSFGYFNVILRNHLWLHNMNSFKRSSIFPSIESFNFDEDDTGDKNPISAEPPPKTEQDEEYIERLKEFWKLHLWDVFKPTTKYGKIASAMIPAIFSTEWHNISNRAKRNFYKQVRKNYEEMYHASPESNAMAHTLKIIKRRNQLLYRNYLNEN